MKQFHRIDQGARRDPQIDDSEVRVQSVTNELATAVHEEPEFGVERFAAHEPVGTGSSVEIARPDT